MGDTCRVIRCGRDDASAGYCPAHSKVDGPTPLQRVKDLEKSVKELEAANEALTRYMERLQQDRQEQQEDLEDSRTETEEVKAEVESLNGRLKQSDADYTNAKTETENWRKRYGELQGVMRERILDIDDLLEVQASKNAALERSTEEYNKLRDHVNEVVHDRSCALDKLNTDLQRRTVQLAECTMARDLMADEVKRLSTRIAAALALLNGG